MPDRAAATPTDKKSFMRALLTRLHQLAGFGEVKPLESLGRASKGRHYTGSEGSGGRGGRAGP